MTTNNQLPTTSLGALRTLAHLWGVQTSYTDIAGHHRVASPDSLLRVLQALGAPLSGLRDVADALRERTAARAAEVVPPVIVVRSRPPQTLDVRLTARTPADMELRSDAGIVHRWAVTPAPGSAAQRITLPVPLAPGYYTLRIQTPGGPVTSHLIVAPRRVFGGTRDKRWGVFLPLYALRTAEDWGAGTYPALGRLAEWIRSLGGSVVATLPLLPVFLDQPFDPSPYAPVSRKWWNEFYIDVTKAPELSYAPAAREALASPEFRRALRARRRASLVDYRGQMAQDRRLLELLAEAFFTQGPAPRREAFAAFLAGHPAAHDYAAFRAVMDRQGRPWRQWPARLRGGDVRRDDYDETARRYHLYAQWIAAEQFAAASAAMRAHGGIVYLDLPLGAHADGYDVWRDADAFADGISVGAPPDTFFGKGQDWGSPPLHPERLRAEGYRYYIECLRHHLAHANLLRIDHVMGLHRFFWIPRGLAPSDGVYVRYRADELYAILAVESLRYGAMIVGENLGTVPSYVNGAMRAHGVLQTYVVQYAMRPDAAAPIAPVPADAVASLNTHDMPPFGAFWMGRDLRDLVALGQLAAAQAAEQRKRRMTMLRRVAMFLRRQGRLRGTVTPRRMLRGLLTYLGTGPARVVLVNLEDLWLERRPQNTPGTADERPNWRHRARYSLDQIRTMRAVGTALRTLDRSRRGEI